MLENVYNTMLRLLPKLKKVCCTSKEFKGIHTKNTMACSRYEYVKHYEQDDRILPNVWIVIRVDGKGFHKFSKIHNFDKPNDRNALNLMNRAAITVMQEFYDIILSYGQSDEYSFIFRKETGVFNRRASKLLSYVTSLFTSSYVMHWPEWMGDRQLKYPPCFDGRIVKYPSDQNLRDYLCWRQADVHINNLYNTAFWNLVLKQHLTTQEAEAELKGSDAAFKNELLYSKFGINYNNEPAMFRKGTILLRKIYSVPANYKNTTQQFIIPFHEDIIRDGFWKTHTELLEKYIPGIYVSDASDDEIPELLFKQLRTDSSFTNTKN